MLMRAHVITPVRDDVRYNSICLMANAGDYRKKEVKR